MLDVTMLLTGHIRWHLHEEKEERLKKGKTTRRRGGEKTINIAFNIYLHRERVQVL
jgi:hypothetical protein